MRSCSATSIQPAAVWSTAAFKALHRSKYATIRGRASGTGEAGSSSDTGGAGSDAAFCRIIFQWHEHDHGDHAEQNSSVHFKLPPINLCRQPEAGCDKYRKGDVQADVEGYRMVIGRVSHVVGSSL